MPEASNFVDIPMDCPTRERLGWTGDAQIFFSSASYMYDVAAFYRKWLCDMRDAQNANGKMSAVVPYNGFAMLYDNTGTSVGWADAAVLIPYKYYQAYRDITVLRENYSMSRRYAEFMIKNAGPANKRQYGDIQHREYIYEKGFHLGEWLEPEQFQDKIAAGKKIQHTEICTAYYAYTMRCMSKIARLVDEQEDAVRYEKHAQGARMAYQELYLQDIPKTNRQAVLVRPIIFDLAGKQEMQKLGVRLAEAAEHFNYRIGTGFLSTAYLLPALTQTGHLDTAYRMLENRLNPGWLYEVEQGATTVWENWEGTESHNHYSPGAVCEWLYSTVLGIQVTGENQCLIKPQPEGSFTMAEGTYQSIYGKISSRWEKDGEKIQYTVQLPANMQGILELPDGKQISLPQGIYSITQ